MDKEHSLIAEITPLFLLSIGGWLWGYSRHLAGRPFVQYEPRRPVPWGGGWVLLTIVLYFAATVIIHPLVEISFMERLSPQAKVDFQSLDFAGRMAYPGYFVTALKSDCAGKLLAVAIVTMLLMTAVRADARDLGLSMHRLWRNIGLGIAGFFVIVPSALLLQTLIVRGLNIKYDHDLINALGADDRDPETVYWSLFAAVFVAPLVEEYVLRGLLQGWLERVFGRRAGIVNAPPPLGPAPNLAVARDVNLSPTDSAGSTAHESVLRVSPEELAAADPTAATANATTTVDAFGPPPFEQPQRDQPDDLILADDLGQAESAAPIARPKPSLAPIIITSALFGLMHYGQGPAPITLFFLSLGLSYLYRQTHSIWPGVVVHFMLNSFSMALVLAGVKPE